MISYELYHQIRTLFTQRGLTFAQIARELGIHAEAVSKWARAEAYAPRPAPPRKSVLDAHKPTIRRLLEHHPYSVAQLFTRLRADEAYAGGLSILKDYVRRVRPVRAAAFLTLAFAPCECAKVDWGSAGTLSLGSTSRRLSFFVMECSATTASSMPSSPWARPPSTSWPAIKTPSRSFAACPRACSWTTSRPPS
ncbi:MAG: helix-turn-helix transcriptional regulator [Verrucomicrobia bacterium]|nr:helix-turn-helix transcriptional regulator [Verrucomicrobiota bacterium]